ncbi:MAG: hypothetical protein ACJ78M_03230 [Gemmatimonadaceae bacterium]
MSTTDAAIAYAVLCIAAGPGVVAAQGVSAAADRTTCAALLANDTGVGTRVGVGVSDSANRARDTTARPRADSASFGLGGARTGAADVLLLVGVHADQVRFGSQPHVRARLCWGGDTLRVIQRDNLPSPVVPGTTYRNVFIAVELIGRVNAECLADRIGVGGAQQPPRQPSAQASRVGRTAASLSNCAFLGGAAGAGAGNPRPPAP